MNPAQPTNPKQSFFSKHKKVIIITGSAVILLVASGVVAVSYSMTKQKAHKIVEPMLDESSTTADKSAQTDPSVGKSSDTPVSADTSSKTPTSSGNASSGPTTSAPPTTPPDAPTTHTITYSSNFAPSTLTIKSGDTVIMKNDSGRAIFPASDPHPGHNLNPELDFGTISPGGQKSIKLTTVGSWGYHDHLMSSKVGTIIVQ